MRKLWTKTKPKASETGHDSKEKKITTNHFNGNVLFIFDNFIYTHEQTHAHINARYCFFSLHFVNSNSNIRNEFRVCLSPYLYESQSMRNIFGLAVVCLLQPLLGSICAQTIYFLTEHFSWPCLYIYLKLLPFDVNASVGRRQTVHQLECVTLDLVGLIEFDVATMFALCNKIALFPSHWNFSFGLAVSWERKVSDNTTFTSSYALATHFAWMWV